MSLEGSAGGFEAELILTSELLFEGVGVEVVLADGGMIDGSYGICSASMMAGSTKNVETVMVEGKIASFALPSKGASSSFLGNVKMAQGLLSMKEVWNVYRNSGT